MYMQLVHAEETIIVANIKMLDTNIMFNASEASLYYQQVKSYAFCRICSSIIMNELININIGSVRHSWTLCSRKYEKSTCRQAKNRNKVWKSFTLLLYAC